MSIRREWLDWDKPCLPVAAAWLIDQSQRQDSNESASTARENSAHGICDLRRVLCVLPGRRAGRLLLAQLSAQCQRRRLVLFPPAVLTPSSMVDRVLELDTSGIAIASELEVTLAWTKALRQCDATRLAPLLPRQQAQTDIRAWQDLAQTIAQLHQELSSEHLTFADVAERADRLEMCSQGDRWRTLDALHKVYRDILSQSGLVDRHDARRSALGVVLAGSRQRTADGVNHAPHRTLQADTIEKPQPRLVLIGVVELNGIQRQSVAHLGDAAVALVHAPLELQDRFDDFGCINTQSWTDVAIDIDDREQLRVGEGPTDQAQHALRAIAALHGEFAADEISVGLGDPTLAPALQQAAKWAGLNMRPAGGTPLRLSPPYLFLQAAANWLSDQRFAHFAALLRHGDVQRWIVRHEIGSEAGPRPPHNPKPSDRNAVDDWLTLLDRYFADHLNGRLTGEWLGDPDTRKALKKVYDAVGLLLEPLDEDRSAGPQPPRQLCDWCQPILDVLAKLYGDDDSLALGDGQLVGGHDSSRLNAHGACAALAGHLQQFVGVHRDLQPRIDATTALGFLLTQAANDSLPEPSVPEQIEMLGWLELHLDPAPVLIITGFNDGHIPTVAAVDAGGFLPDSLRATLGLAHNAQRFARDAYLFEAIRHSRKHLALVAGRQDAQGDSLAPSRFLLACDAEKLVSRVRRLCGEATRHLELQPIGIRQPEAERESRFKIVDLSDSRPPPPPAWMRVTDFRLYLECPGRFALRRIFALQRLDDNLLELDASGFGSLAHDVLRAFGRDDSIANSADAGEIEKYLLAALAREAATRFGKSPLPAVQVQIARLQQRLRSFARRQAELASTGWRIHQCEFKLDESCVLDIPSPNGQNGATPPQPPMPIRGVIDRIDVNQDTGAWRILDYKTSEDGRSPHTSHHGSEDLPSTIADLDWCDLQLPLYEHLVRQSTLKIAGEITLGYICLPRWSDQTAVLMAQWGPEHLACAVDCARQVVRDIRAGKFAFRRDFAGKHDDFARICQTAAFRNDDEGDEEGAEDE